jgi:hypothetical protein
LIGADRALRCAHDSPRGARGDLDRVLQRARDENRQVQRAALAGVQGDLGGEAALFAEGPVGARHPQRQLERLRLRRRIRDAHAYGDSARPAGHVPLEPDRLDRHVGPRGRANGRGEDDEQTESRRACAHARETARPR